MANTFESMKVVYSISEESYIFNDFNSESIAVGITTLIIM